MSNATSGKRATSGVSACTCTMAGVNIIILVLTSTRPLRGDSAMRAAPMRPRDETSSCTHPLYSYYNSTPRGVQVSGEMKMLVCLGMQRHGRLYVYCTVLLHLLCIQRPNMHFNHKKMLSATSELELGLLKKLYKQNSPLARALPHHTRF